MKSVEYYQKKHEKLWSAFENKGLIFDPVLKRGFAFQFDGVQDVDILFLGINPSYKEGAEEWRGHYANVGLTNAGYFKSFSVIQESLENSPYSRKSTFTHLDICALRETKQKFFKHLFRTDEGVDFVIKQAEISREILEEIKPKVIVCSNTMARLLLGKERSKNGKEGIWMGYEFEFKEELGTHIITGNSEEETNLDGTPIFFTSMLSGQRALDNGSKERLIWHINKALEWKK